jgi:hypothetical protein
MTQNPVSQNVFANASIAQLMPPLDKHFKGIVFFQLRAQNF